MSYFNNKQFGGYNFFLYCPFKWLHSTSCILYLANIVQESLEFLSSFFWLYSICIAPEKDPLATLLYAPLFIAWLIIQARGRGLKIFSVIDAGIEPITATITVRAIA